jgi:hypothetical protein
MYMIPFSTTMYPDDVVLFRATKVTSDMGGAELTYPDPGIPLTANVQSKRVDRAAKGGVTISVTLQAKQDDRIEWMGRKLLVEAGTIPKGTGNVTFHTPCVESK